MPRTRSEDLANGCGAECFAEPSEGRSPVGGGRLEEAGDCLDADGSWLLACCASVLRRGLAALNGEEEDAEEALAGSTCVSSMLLLSSSEMQSAGAKAEGEGRRGTFRRP